MENVKLTKEVKWGRLGLLKHFIRGYEDRRENARYSLDYPGGSLAGDAYLNGWNLCESEVFKNTAVTK